MNFAAWILALSISAQAQQADLLERSFSGVSMEKTAVAAKKDIQEQATLKVSEEIIKELIGDERFARNRSLIISRIVKNSGRYIPFSKPSEVSSDGEGFKMSVSMKVSLRDLKQLLQVNSLLSENDTAPVVLPTITMVDRVEGRTYRWWSRSQKEDNAFLIKEGRRFEEALRNSFQKNNFFMIKPMEAGLVNSIPIDFQSEKISWEDAQFLSQYFSAPLLVDGQVTFSKADQGKYWVEVRMTALQLSNGRTIADVSRKFETEKGHFEFVMDKKVKEVSEAATNDLASQVLEAWQRGSIGTSVIRVTVKGKTTLPLFEAFKNRVRSQITQVKNIRERMITSESVSFEVDASATAQELMAKMEALDVNGRKLARVSDDINEIVLKWLE